jgi:D-tyrosyl-tRNA(Tyr) deacylase
MRAVVQRVSQASVTAQGQVVGTIGPGLMVLIAVAHGDTDRQAEWLARKVAGLRIFEDQDGKMNHSVVEIGGSVLVVSQFTLYADTRKGNRPGFTHAAWPDVADPLIERFVEHLRGWELPVQTGEFGAHMQVEIHNDGPVTIIIDTPS